MRQVTSYNRTTVRLCVNTGRLVFATLLAVSFWMERAKSEKSFRRPRLVCSNSVLALVRMIAQSIDYVETDC